MWERSWEAAATTLRQLPIQLLEIERIVLSRKLHERSSGIRARGSQAEKTRDCPSSSVTADDLKTLKTCRPQMAFRADRIYAPLLRVGLQGLSLLREAPAASSACWKVEAGCLPPRPRETRREPRLGKPGS